MLSSVLFLGVETDGGFILEYGDYPKEIFDGFDYGLLADIHKHQKIDQEGKFKYCRAVRFSRIILKKIASGFLIWNIKDKKEFTYKHISIQNPSPFISVELDPTGELPSPLNVPENAKLRLICNTHLSSQVLKKTIDITKKRFSPQSITIHNRPGKTFSIEEIGGTYEEDNLRDIRIQEKLIEEYLKDYKLEKKVLYKIFDLNKKYNSLAEQTEDIARNVHWKLKTFEWENLFNYGPNNKINFDKMNGNFGLFGPNYSGKSSSLEALIWTIFNSTAKNIKKNVDIINENKNDAYGKVEIEIDNKIYIIERKLEKYIKKLYGEETIEAKTYLNFSSFNKLTEETENLNGEDRNGTDFNIRKIFGTIEDFLLTSMAGQLEQMSFIQEGSTKRKEILGKFLDLEMFDKKFKLAKDDTLELKTSIKKLENKQFDKEIFDAIQENEKVDKEIQKNKISLRELKRENEEKTRKYINIENKISSEPKNELIDIEKINKQFDEVSINVRKITSSNTVLNEQISEDSKTLKKYIEILKEFDIKQLEKDKNSNILIQENVNKTKTNLKILENDIKNKQEKIKILDMVPCGDKFPECRFLIDANKQKNEIIKVQDKTKQFIVLEETELKKLNDLKISLLKFEEFSKTKENISQLESNIKDKQLKLEKNKNLLKSFETIKNDLEIKKKIYNENEVWMKELKILNKNKIEVKLELQNLNNNIDYIEKKNTEFYQKIGFNEQKRIILEKEKQELSVLRDEYLAGELFLKSMSSNGIVFNIIKNQLPLINQEINKILSNIVEFEISLEDDGKKLEILIKHPKYNKRPIETGSGAEKQISSLAIRLAFIKVSSLPKGDLLILDEPGSALDTDHFNHFSNLLQTIKQFFKTVILISHIDSLKDAVDNIIEIEKINGFARINL